MPSQRETRAKPLTLLQVGGVNQRVKSTELPLHEYVTLNGVWPEFAGLQSRLWGKRVLQKYPNPIYGIHQFWTPMGYGGGIYQFNGTVDFGFWLTPVNSFDLTIPPLAADGGGMTLDEFGNSMGGNFGYGTDNTCLISFLDGSTDHSVCLPPPSPASIVDDHNAGPAGQGKKCEWVESFFDTTLDSFVTIKELGTGNYSTVTNTANIGRPEFGCAVAPANPPPLGPDPFFQFYNAIVTTGAISCIQNLSASWAFVPEWTIPGCDGRVTVTQAANPTSNHKVTFNFGLLKSVGAYAVAMKVNGPHISLDQFIVLATAAEINNSIDVHVDMSEHLGIGDIIHPSFGVTERHDSVSADIIRVFTRKRVCT